MSASPKLPEFRTLDYVVEDGVAIATFNRPEKMNTFTSAMMYDLLHLFDVTDADDDVRAVIVTGSGRAFCAGADLDSGGDTFDFDRHAGRKNQIAGVHRDGGMCAQLSVPRIHAIGSGGSTIGKGAKCL